mmetsp:Transcript_3995/g.12759  ORF Transcript_3995/g.12759 Transcript_3995/m.12759 type:complete len:235 (-) Transcript_3995:812-1516(-)
MPIRVIPRSSDAHHRPCRRRLNKWRSRRRATVRSASSTGASRYATCSTRAHGREKRCSAEEVGALPPSRYRAPSTGALPDSTEGAPSVRGASNTTAVCGTEDADSDRLGRAGAGRPQPHGVRAPDTADMDPSSPPSISSPPSPPPAPSSPLQLRLLSPATCWRRNRGPQLRAGVVPAPVPAPDAEPNPYPEAPSSVPASRSTGTPSKDPGLGNVTQRAYTASASESGAGAEVRS